MRLRSKHQWIRTLLAANAIPDGITDAEAVELAAILLQVAETDADEEPKS